MLVQQSLVLIKPDAVIRDGDGVERSKLISRPICRRDSYFRRDVRLSEFEGVRDQILYHLPHLGRVGGHRRQVARFYRRSCFLDLDLKVRQNFARDPFEIYFYERLRLGCDTREREEVLY